MNPSDPDYRGPEELLREIYGGRDPNRITDQVRFCVYDEDALQEVKTALWEEYERQTRGHIWQRGVGLTLETKKDYIMGTLRYGDNVDDEWLLVGVLLDFSRMRPSTYIRVEDDDGEFLLIEAAHHLPEWLDEHNAGGRVWLHAGNVCIVEQNVHAKGPLVGPRLATAYPSAKANHDITKAIRRRVERASAAAKESLHYTLMLIPRPVAAFLIQDDQLVSKLAQQICYGDVALFTDSKSPRLFPPTDLVQLSVKMTRTLYAMISQRQLPALTSWRHLVDSTTGREATMVDIGMKVTCSLEQILRLGRDKDILGTWERIQKQPLPTNRMIKARGDRNDDDSFLDMSEADFSKLMGSHTDRDALPTPDAHLQKIVEGIQDFMKGSNLDDEALGLSERESEDENDASDGPVNNIQFDSDQFLRFMGLDKSSAAAQAILGSDDDKSESDGEAVSNESGDDEEMGQGAGEGVDFDRNLAENILRGLQDDPTFALNGPLANLLNRPQSGKQ